MSVSEELQSGVQGVKDHKRPRCAHCELENSKPLKREALCSVRGLWQA